jgi:hypothetical protein
MTACAILVIVVMTTSILVVMRSKIVLIRVTMVIVYLSGTPPGLSLSARFRPGFWCTRTQHIIPGDMSLPRRRSWAIGSGLCGLRPLYCPWPRFADPSLARPSLCALSVLRGTSGRATMTTPGGAGTHSREHCNFLRARRTGFSHTAGASPLSSGPYRALSRPATKCYRSGCRGSCAT